MRLYHEIPVTFLVPKEARWSQPCYLIYKGKLCERGRTKLLLRLKSLTLNCFFYCQYSFECNSPWVDCSQSPIFRWDFRDSYASIDCHYLGLQRRVQPQATQARVTGERVIIKGTCSPNTDIARVYCRLQALLLFSLAIWLVYQNIPVGMKILAYSK